jgi:hypothetical protein
MQPIQFSDTTIAAMNALKNDEFLKKFQAHEHWDMSNLLDKITLLFRQHEVPIGLLNKLLVLSEYEINFIIDDSGSMENESDALLNQASVYIQNKVKPNYQIHMTRWQEAEDRLHVMLDILAYIPTQKITISFLNRAQKIELTHSYKTPEEFAAQAHREVSRAFQSPPQGRTPIYQKLQQAFTYSTSNTCHKLFTDGEPSDATIERVTRLILSRPNPKANPLTLISCTNDTQATTWMKEIEGRAPYVSELDDFVEEQKEVLNSQGKGFVFLPKDFGYYVN